MGKHAQVAVYYFPNFHRDARMEAIHGKDWSEWELIRLATSRFPGHDQPKIPLWGFEDESDPKVMSKKIDAAAKYGIDAFIFDWYWYEGPFLQNALDRGFLASGNQKLQFALMWANHDWYNFHPGNRDHSYKMDFRWSETPETIGRVWDHLIERYLKHPLYFRIDGLPYFSIYAMNRFIIQMGGVEGTAKVIDDFRRRARKAGLPGVHVNGIWFDNLDRDPVSACPQKEWHDRIGISSYTSYNVPMFTMPDLTFPRLDHRRAFDFYLPLCRKALATLPAPYYPVVTMGWDSSPRTVQSERYEHMHYPYLPVAEATPELFAAEIADALECLRGRPDSERILFINAWNEWTEGSYLEPDRKHGFAFLESLYSAVSTFPSGGQKDKESF